MHEISNATHFISNLSSTGLMALIIVILGLVVKNFYEKSEKERKVLLEKIFNSIKSIDSRLEETNNNQKTATLIAESQKDLLEKNYQLQNNNVNKAVENVNDSMYSLNKEVEKVEAKVDGVKKDTEALKKAAAVELKRTETLMNLYKRNENK